jgi:hypothetical protein
VPLYDDGGTVQPEKNDQEKAADDAAAKDAAMRQAVQEVHMEEAPVSHGTMGDRMDARANRPAVRMQYDTEKPVDESKGVADQDSMAGAESNTQNAPLGATPMSTKNTTAMMPEVMEREASTIKTPRPERMNYTSQPIPEAKPEEAAPDPMEIIQQDKLAAMKKGTAGLSDLGTSLIHERLMKDGTATPELAPETAAMPQYTGTERIGKGTPGEAEAHKQFEDKRRDYDTRIQAAMDQGTPEGDREAASLQLAKMHFEKMNPLGSAANKPGLLGKIEHGLSKAGQIAGSMTVPEVIQQIPGTEMNRRMLEERAIAGKGAATKESLEQAQARQANIGSKLPPPTQVFDDLKGQINPETNKVYTDQERLDVAQNPGKAGEVTYARKYMKDHPGSTYEDGAADYHRMVAGTKPLNEQERKIADYLSAQKMEDTPQNRDAARVALEQRDTMVKQQTELPFSEAKARFNDNLATTRALLVQQNANASQRGLKADELQQVENARSSAVSSKLQTAKDALNATDEQFSNQIVPIVTLLSVTSAEGVKRVNKQELDKFVPTSGSFGRWISGHSDQFLSGQIPAEYRAEVGHMLDRMTAAEVAEHIINTRSIDSTIRQGAQQPVQKPEGGAAAKPVPSKPQAPEVVKPVGGTSGFAAWKATQNQPK